MHIHVVRACMSTTLGSLQLIRISGHGMGDLDSGGWWGAEQSVLQQLVAWGIRKSIASFDPEEKNTNQSHSNPRKWDYMMRGMIGKGQQKKLARFELPVSCC
jgi:hypothetical protein